MSTLSSLNWPGREGTISNVKLNLSFSLKNFKLSRHLCTNYLWGARHCNYNLLNWDETETTPLNHSGITFLTDNLRYTMDAQKRFYSLHEIVINSGRSKVIGDNTLGNLTVQMSIWTCNNLLQTKI